MPAKKTDTVFENIKNSLLTIDPIYFCEKYLTLDGKDFRINKNGYKPFSDIYRYIGVKALDKDSKPVIMVKGRQVGATTMASALEMFFVGCGHFGTADKPPIRIVHAFPQLDIAYSYTKTKLNPMISSSKPIDEGKKNISTKSYMQSLVDPTGGDSLQFKQFKGGNYLFIESTGVDGNRLRGKTADVMFFDECFPFDQCIETRDGKKQIGNIYLDFINGKKVFVKTFNEQTEIFEYKKVTNAWKRGEKDLIQITCGNREIKCTPNHKFLTEFGWQEAASIKSGTLLKTSNSNNIFIRALNEDQHQIVLGSFLGDGSLQTYKNSRYRLRIIHGSKQKDYCKWKASIFNIKTKTILKNGYAKTQAETFSTKIFGLNKDVPKTKTNCPQWILDQIDARGIAIWFMDDASVLHWKNKNNTDGYSVCISTCSFDEDSHIRMVEKFKNLGIDCKYKKYYKNNNKSYFSLYFNKNASEKLFNLIKPYVHQNIAYKIPNFNTNNQYTWNNKYKNYNFTVVDSISKCNEKEYVYDIEVEDNHNFILTSSKKSKNLGGPIVHNCQDMAAAAIGNSTKILNKAQYGAIGQGVQVYFGTPKRRNSEYWRMWNKSSQQYYYLGCQDCKKHFPLYTPGTNEWESIWLYEFTVKCTHCGCEQDKRDAAERGKWVALKNIDECDFIGFHINQLYNPEFTKEKIIAEKPENSAINTERAYQNEVLGEFFYGDSSIITADEIREKCGDSGRKFAKAISPGPKVFVGIDIGKKAAIEQLVDNEKSKSRSGGQSYSSVVVLLETSPGVLSIQYAWKFAKNDWESKKSYVRQVMKQYSATLGICDIGYANDFNEVMQSEFGDRFLSSQVMPTVNGKVKFYEDQFPKFIGFEKDFWIEELYEQLRKGNIRFPMGSYEEIAWLIQHCSSMEIKPSISRTGEVKAHYVKGTMPNDGFMALLNAYLAYKYHITEGFKLKNPATFNKSGVTNKPPVVTGFLPRMR